MNKIKLFGFILIAGLILGCSGEIPIPLEGVYSLKTKTLTIFDLLSEEYEINSNIAEVVEAKPEKITIDFDLKELNEYRFGSFKFGNNNNRTWFVLGKDDEGFWSEFYIDQNNDLKIKKNEKIKSFQSGQDRVKRFDRSESVSLIPVQIRVSYKGLTGEIQKNLYFFIITTVLSKNDASDLIVKAVTASFLDGEIQVVTGESTKRMNFRLIDANSNGCFNDYGTDLFFIDKNSDDYYRASESHKLVEFFDLSASTGGEKQLRIILPPYPAKMAIIEAGGEYDLADLEAKSDAELDQEADDSPAESKDSDAKQYQQAASK